ncbi:MAG: arsenite efflux transporter metallochaperone ArsD [Cyanobacteria bacterium REEB67]|nr:arsenite efflux transporter metallochaperone ArsD [Cyanobacteria bacterium REEB67]
MKIQIFDPPMCCSTGLCGPGVDPALVEFAANLDWLKRQGIEIERYNLTQQTAAFVNNEPVCQLLKIEGNNCLPIVLMDGKVAFKGIYPDKQSLAKLVGVELASGSSSLKFTVETTGSPASGCCSKE